MVARTWSRWPNLAWLLAACLAASSVGAKDLFVSAKGDDVSGDGSSSAPFRTITRALREVDGNAATQVTIRLAMGTYDAGAGESFPLRLPPGLQRRLEHGPT